MQQNIQADLASFDIGDYKSAPKWKTVLWYLVNYLIFNSFVPWPYTIKARILRLFGAKVGKGLVIKANVRIKNPWKLEIGNHSWIGESVWIDNLENVTIGSNVCISQNALLLTGNHDFSKTTFPYRLAPIIIEDGAWIGAQSTVCPGTICESHAVLTVGSVATKSLSSWGIYSGNPACLKKYREMFN